MCEQCIAKTILIGEIAKGFYLVKATCDGYEMEKGDLGIVRCNDPEIIIPSDIKTSSDPFFEKEDSEIDDNDKFCDFVDLVANWGNYLVSSLDFGFEFYKACEDGGWNKDKHGHINFWIVHKIGILIENFDKQREEMKVKYTTELLKKAADVLRGVETEANLNYQQYREKVNSDLFNLNEDLYNDYKKYSNTSEPSEFMYLINSILEDDK